MIIDGYDLTKTLFKKEKSPRKEMFYYNGGELYAVRLNDFKLHFKTSDWFKQPKIHNPPLLYNLNIDPSEKLNIANENPEKIKEILKLVEDHKSKMVKGEDQMANRL